jgi:hypothetical protein
MRTLVLVALSGAVLALMEQQSTPAFAQSNRFCEDYAHGYANRRARRGVMRTTGVGAGLGTAIGAIANGSSGAGTGAAIGSGIGLVSGGFARRNNYDFYFSRAFARCMQR